MIYNYVNVFLIKMKNRKWKVIVASNEFLIDIKENFKYTLSWKTCINYFIYFSWFYNFIQNDNIPIGHIYKPWRLIIITESDAKNVIRICKTYTSLA